MMNKIIVQVAIDAPFYQLFDYFFLGDPTTIQPGLRVVIPFGTRKIIGLIVSATDHSDYPLNKLKAIETVLDQTSLLTKPLIKLCQWAADYYHHPFGEVLFHAMPTLLRQGKESLPSHRMTYHINHAPTDLRGEKQQALWEFMKNTEDEVNKNTLKANHITSDTIQRAVKNGWLLASKKIKLPSTCQTTPLTYTLNPEQQAHFETITQQLDQFNVFTLYGITGSGKTAVYLKVIERVIQQGKQALILVPEISLTPQTIARFERYFTVPLVALHSGLSDRQRRDAWVLAKQAKALIVIGTRSALFTPLPHLGIIVLDEEHDLSFKQQKGFRYCARDLALVRGQQAKIPVILGSATPSLETLYNVIKKGYPFLQLTQRATGSVPDFYPIDLRHQQLIQGLSPQLLDAVQTHLNQGEQVILFLNRRGFSPALICHDCSWSAQCVFCDAKLVFHQVTHHLQCHHCGMKRKKPVICPQCNSNQLLTIGLGTERVETLFKNHFKDTPILRIDRDSTQRKGSFEAMLQTIQTGKPQILIGTQLLAKGHHFPNVTLVGILDADYGFYSNDFRALEQMAQLIIQVAGRAGREKKPGKVLIQTYHPHHPLLHCLLKEGYLAFAKKILQERFDTKLPPFGFLALIRADANQTGKAIHFLHTIKKQLLPLPDPTIKLLGPAPALMERRAGRYRAQLLLQSTQRKSLHQLLKKITVLLQKQKTKLRYSIDVDPKEM